MMKTPKLITPQQRQRVIQRVLWLTLLLNLIVMTIKILVGMATGSISLAADGLQADG